jgi:predicted dienelactone hydrolase
MSAPAPAMRREMDKAFGTITIPVMHMTGTEDFLEIFPQTTAADRRIPFDQMSNAETCLVTFTDGDHFIFSGRERVAAPEKIAQDTAFQKLICTSTTAFWDAYLKGDAAAKKWLLDGGCETMLGAQASLEHKAPKAQPK